MLCKKEYITDYDVQAVIQDLWNQWCWYCKLSVNYFCKSNSDSEYSIVSLFHDI